MSYCRLSGDSDVYVYQSVEGGIVCCFCRLSENSPAHSPRFENAEEMLKHLARHIAKGHAVPTYAIERLQAEAA